MTERWTLFKRNLLEFWKVFRRHRPGILGAVLLASALFLAVFGEWLTPHRPLDTIRDESGRALTFSSPAEHGPLGTDDAGHDIWALLVYGSRISLMVGFLAGLLSMVIGSLLGILAGYFGGWVDTLLMRATDVLLVIPDIPLMIILVATVRQLNLGISPIVVLIGVIGLLYWTSTARLIRSQVLSIKERQFLGLGDPTQPSWGTMINFAFSRNAITNGAWWFYLPPGLAIVWVSLGCVLLGNVLEELLNPRLASHHLEGDEKMVARPKSEAPESAPVPAVENA
jgi:peptide/nickel transport system permease protein